MAKRTAARRPRLSARALTQFAADGLDHDAIAAALNKSPAELRGSLKRSKRYQAAMARGRLIATIREAARACADLPTLAAAVGKSPTAAAALIDNDPELSDIWQRTRAERLADLRRSLDAQVKEGKYGALKLALDRMSKEADRDGGASLTALSPTQICEVFSVSRQTLTNWRKKGFDSAARNGQAGTYHLAKAIEWYTAHKLATAPAGATQSDTQARYDRARAERIELANARARRDLLPRAEIMAGLVARAHRFAAPLHEAAEAWPELLAGQPAPAIREFIEKRITPCMDALADVPLNLELPPKLAKRFARLLSDLTKGAAGE